MEKIKDSICNSLLSFALCSKSWQDIMWMAFSSDTDTFNLDVPRPWRNGYRTVNEDRHFIYSP